MGSKPDGAVCLIVTRKCNLSCKYCYVRDKRSESMTLAAAQKVIEDAFERGKERFASLSVEFIGGEPLCEFEMLRQLLEWAESRTWPLPYVFYATTNGTLLNDERKAWFRQHRDRFVLGLSYDGSELAQDANRSGSGSAIDVAFFRDTWPAQSFKMTIDEDSVSVLARNAIELMEQGIRIDANIACGMPLWREASFREYGRQLVLLVEYALAHPDREPFALLREFNFPQLALQAGRAGRRHCGAGREFESVDMDGKRYPCHLMSPLALSEEQLCEHDYAALMRLDAPVMTGCEGCPLDSACPACYGMNAKLFGNPFQREENICRTYRLQFVAACRLFLGRLRQKQSPTQADRAIARAILNLYPLVQKQPICRPAVRNAEAHTEQQKEEFHVIH